MRKGQFEILEEATQWVRPDPYLVSHTLTDWSARVRAAGALRTIRCIRRQELAPAHASCVRLRVLVFHPDDQDGQELIGQLSRIGCQVKAFWPPLDKLTEEADLIFFAMRPEILTVDLPWLRKEGLPPMIAVVNYENPVIVEAVLRLNAYGVIASPVKSFGLLTAIVVAVNQAENSAQREKYVVRLEQRLAPSARSPKPRRS